VLPGYEFGNIFVAGDIFTFYSQPLTWENLPSMLGPANGGEYELGSSGGGLFGTVPGSGTQAVIGAFSAVLGLLLAARPTRRPQGELAGTPQ
jgi:hypothetical protein